MRRPAWQWLKSRFEHIDGLRIAVGVSHHAAVRSKMLVWGGCVVLIVALLGKQWLTRSMSLHMLVHIPLILMAGVMLGRGWALRAFQLGLQSQQSQQSQLGQQGQLGQQEPQRQQGQQGQLLSHEAAKPHAEVGLAEQTGQTAQTAQQAPRGLLLSASRRSAADASQASGPQAGGLWAQLNQHGLAGLLLCSFMGAYWMIPKALDDVLLSGQADVFKFVSVLAVGWLLQDSALRANNVIQLFFLGNFCWMSAIVGMLYRENPQRLCNFYLLGDQEIAGTGLIVLAILLPVAWLWIRRRYIWRFLQ